MLNNKLQNITLGILVLLVSIFIVVFYAYMQSKEISPPTPKYVVNWEKNVDKTTKFLPVFKEVDHSIAPSPTPQLLTEDIIDSWLETDDSGLINYAQAPIIENSLWPVYSSWTLINVDFVDKEAPNDVAEIYSSNAKSFMKYQTLGYDDWNRQGHLVRQKEAYTGNHYIRMIDGRMLIALGQYYSSTIGTYIDVELEDGTILACILGDVKATADTDIMQRYCVHDNSVLEFIIDSQGLNSADYSRIKTLEPISGSGNYSTIPEFKSPVKSVRVYDKVYDIDMTDISNDNPDTNDTRR